MGSCFKHSSMASYSRFITCAVLFLMPHNFICQYGGSGFTQNIQSNQNIADYQDYFNDDHGFDPNQFPNCQCEYIFNKLGQGNCNSGATQKTDDEWCYVAVEFHENPVNPLLDCPDAVASNVYQGRYWSHVACDTPKPKHK